MKPLTILFVDDDEIERIKFKKVCKKYNFNNTIIEAQNGENAITLLRSKIHSFNLIITDNNMPKMNGIEFLKELKSNHKLKKIPVIFLSSSNDQADIKKCYDLGVSDYFIKPVMFSEYQTKINSILEYWHKSEIDS